MRKKIFFFGLVIVGAIVGAFNLNLAPNKEGDLRLKNIEVLSYGEGSGGGYNCTATGSLICPSNGTKVYMAW